MTNSIKLEDLTQDEMRAELTLIEKQLALPVEEVAKLFSERWNTLASFTLEAKAERTRERLTIRKEKLEQRLAQLTAKDDTAAQLKLEEAELERLQGLLSRVKRLQRIGEARMSQIVEQQPTTDEDVEALAAEYARLKSEGAYFAIKVGKVDQEIIAQLTKVKKLSTQVRLMV